MWSKPPAGARPNLGHPHAKGLRHCFLFNERSGRLVTDCVGGLQATFAGSPVWSGRLHGGSLRFDGASDLQLVPGRSVFNRAADNGPYTVVAGLMQTGSQAGFQTVWANGGAGLYVNGGRLTFYASDGARLTLALHTPYVVSASAVGPTPGTKVPGLVEYSINGRLDMVTTSYVALPVLSGRTIGGHGGEFFIGEISFLYLYDRYLPNGPQPNAEFEFPPTGPRGVMQSLQVDPFAMFAPTRRYIDVAATVPAAVVGGETVTTYVVPPR